MVAFLRRRTCCHLMLSLSAGTQLLAGSLWSQEPSQDRIVSLLRELSVAPGPACRPAERFMSAETSITGTWEKSADGFEQVDSTALWSAAGGPTDICISDLIQLVVVDSPAEPAAADPRR